MTNSISSTSKQSILDIINEICIANGKEAVQNLTDQQMSALIKACDVLAKQLRGNAQPSPLPPPLPTTTPPPPPLPFSRTQFSFNGFNKPMGDALTSQLGNLKKTTKNEKTTGANKLPNAIRRNKGQDLLTQELKQAINRRVPKAEENANKKQNVTTVKNEMHDPSTLPIRDRRNLFSKG